MKDMRFSSSPQAHIESVNAGEDYQKKPAVELILKGYADSSQSTAVVLTAEVAEALIGKLAVALAELRAAK